MASIYPIMVLKQSGRAKSSSGGKDYHLVLVTRADGRSLFITRFGKKNTWGVGFDVQKFENEHEARAAYDKKWAEKIGKAYDECLIDVSRSCNDAKEFRNFLSEQYYYKIGVDNLHFIDSALGAKGVRDGKVEAAKRAATFEVREVGDPFDEFSPIKALKRRPVPKPPVAAETVEDRAKDNPIFGMF